VDVLKPDSFFTMYFDTNGATSPTPAPQSVKIGNRPTQPANPVKPGYTFGGWFDQDGRQWIFGVDAMGTEDVMLIARWLIDAPIVNPINPGETCVTGVGAPGSTAYVYDENGNVIGTVVVGADGTFSYCDESIGEEGSISVELVDPDGNVSNRVVVRKPGSGIVEILPETGVNTLETLLFGIMLILMSLFMSYKLRRE
jgi:uncharacterized repeat protein (TIGR02543 family)/LPXTG-motif cell wall-anchored protein